VTINYSIVYSLNRQHFCCFQTKPKPITNGLFWLNILRLWTYDIGLNNPLVIGFSLVWKHRTYAKAALVCLLSCNTSYSNTNMFHLRRHFQLSYTAGHWWVGYQAHLDLISFINLLDSTFFLHLQVLLTPYASHKQTIGFFCKCSVIQHHGVWQQDGHGTLFFLTSVIQNILEMFHYPLGLNV
jgi:hypothetical protein